MTGTDLGGARPVVEPGLGPTPINSQYGRGQCALLMQPLCLSQPQHLPIGECIHLGSEKLQGTGLQGQRAGQLLPNHLHDLGPPSSAQCCALDPYSEEPLPWLRSPSFYPTYFVKVLLGGPHLLPGLIKQLDAHTEELMETLVLAEEHG